MISSTITYEPIDSPQSHGDLCFFDYTYGRINMININWEKEIADADNEIAVAKEIIKAKTDKKEMPNRFDCFNLTVAYDNLAMILEMQQIQIKHNNHLQKSMDLLIFE